MGGRLFCGGGKLKLLSSCRVQASHSVAFSCDRARAAGMQALVVATCGLSTCGTGA